MSTFDIKAQEDDRFKSEQDALDYYNEKIEYYLNKNIDSSNYFASKGEKLCKKMEEYVEVPLLDTSKANSCAKFYTNLGSIHFIKINYLEALKSFYTAANIYEQTENLKELGYNYINLSTIFKQIDDLQEALKYAQKALLTFENYSYNELGLASAYYNLGVINKDFYHFDDAEHFTRKALSLYSTLKDYTNQAQALNLLAVLSKNSGDTTASINYYSEALSLFKKEGHLIGQANVLNNLGAIYKDLAEIKKSKAFLEKSHRISKSLNYERGEAFAKVNFAKVLVKEKKIKAAIDSARFAFEIGKRIGEISAVEKASKLLISIYKNQNEYKKAFDIQKSYIEIKDHLMDRKKDQIAIQESIRFEIQKEKILREKEKEKEKSLDELKRDRDKLFIRAASIIIVILSLILILGYFQLRNIRRKNREIKKQSEERKLLLQEVHHRVKNNFQIVSSLLRLQYYTLENKEFQSIFDEAIMRINSMATVHDIIYRQEAFSSIDANLYFEKLSEELKRLSEKDIELTTKVSVKIDNIELLIHLGIIINELFINSLKYGFTKNQQNPKIKIVLEQNDKSYSLNYFENGKGFSKENNKASFGMDLIETIMEQHNGKVSIIKNKEWNTNIRVDFTPNI